MMIDSKRSTKRDNNLECEADSYRVRLDAPRILLDSPAMAARRLGTSRQQIYKLLHRGVLTSVKIGKSRKIHIGSIERLAARGA